MILAASPIAFFGLFVKAIDRRSHPDTSNKAAGKSTVVPHWIDFLNPDY